MGEKAETMILTPTGFLSVLIRVERITKESLSDVQSLMLVRRREGDERGVTRRYPVMINRDQTLPLSPGEYFVQAVVGDVISEQVRTTVEAGELTRLVFRFGK